MILLALVEGRLSGLVVSELDSRSKGCGFESRLIQHTRWKWVKPILGSIPAPSSGLCSKKKKNTGSQMGHTKKIS